ncbi:carbonic anhydrase [Pseudomonas duriflava]|uniref:carbonic anhydrase n=1 Tax=Pseudomonas duriflava TaxID=459528 RepID=A0A562QN47_9PSED|nr:carbonic anhydrase family protein [Pseudomonas duriflava]TWI57486.1 carbonic anhydrase [Pseudomonas duriflava]
MATRRLSRHLLVSLLFSLPLPVLAASSQWTYQGQSGPEHWAEVGSSLENALCAKGTAQSPIDIDLHHGVHHKANTQNLKIAYMRSSLTMINNGHTIQATPSGKDLLTYKGDNYHLVQFHFHTPSEHQFNHQAYPMEMHLVNQDKNGHLLVVGLMIKEGKENQELAALWKRLPREEGREVHLTGKSDPDLGRLLPGKGTARHVTYQGSLTTPPCTESVQWVVFEQPIELSHQQIERFRTLFPDNHRPTQQLNARLVDEE